MLQDTARVFSLSFLVWPDTIWLPFYSIDCSCAHAISVSQFIEVLLSQGRILGLVVAAFSEQSQCVGRICSHSQLLLTWRRIVTCARVVYVCVGGCFAFSPSA